MYMASCVRAAAHTQTGNRRMTFQTHNDPWLDYKTNPQEMCQDTVDQDVCLISSFTLHLTSTNDHQHSTVTLNQLFPAMTFGNEIAVTRGHNVS